MGNLQQPVRLHAAGAGAVTNVVFARDFVEDMALGRLGRRGAAHRVMTPVAGRVDVDDPQVAATGALPTGISLSAGGVLSGTPAVYGTYNFTVTATDNSTGTGPYNGSRPYSLTVAAAPPVAKLVSATVAYDSGANTVTLDFSGGTAPTSVTVATQASHGTAVASGTTITYTPTPGYAGPDSFTFS